ncbi:MFS transporter [Metabacillus halosaccharovorans]|nr:MFS transporter [Metabacillus halosaccharovorans]
MVWVRSRLVSLYFWLAAVCVASNIYFLIPMYSDLAEGLSSTYEEAVFSSTVFTFCYAIGLLSFGPVSRTFSKRYVLCFGMFASFLLTFSLTTVLSLQSFYILRGIQGIVLGSFAPVAYAYCFDAFPVKRRTFVIAVINTGFLMAGIIGQLISSTLVHVYNWQAVFYFFSLSYLILSICAIYLLPKVNWNKPVHPTPSSTSKNKLFQAPVIMGLCMTFITLMSFVSFYEELAQYYAGQEKELFFSRSIALIGTPLSLFSGHWFKKTTPQKIMLICLMFMILSFSFMLLVKQLVIITAISIIFVSAIAVFIPSLITFIGEAAAERRATAISLYSFILLTGASIGPIVSSLVSFQSMLVTFIALFGVSFLVLIFLKPQIKG